MSGKDAEKKAVQKPKKLGKISSGRGKAARLARHCRRLRIKAARWDRYREEGRHNDVRTMEKRRMVDEGEMVTDDEGNETWEARTKMRTVTVTRRKLWLADNMRAQVAALGKLLEKRRQGAR